MSDRDPGKDDPGPVVIIICDEMDLFLGRARAAHPGPEPFEGLDAGWARDVMTSREWPEPPDIGDLYLLEEPPPCMPPLRYMRLLARDPALEFTIVDLKAAPREEPGDQPGA